MPPKLSIVTPSLNQGAFIERTIRSVLDQGYPNLEYVIVDGGSTDETVEIIRRYEDRLAWWVSEPDEGQTDAINKGIERTTGEIVAYINSDDYYLPGAFEKAVAGLEGSDANWLGGGVLDLDEHGEPTELGYWRPELPSFYEDFPRGRHWWVVVPFFLPQSSVFWRRELFDRHGLFRRDMHFAFDGEFMVRLALAGEMPQLLQEEALSVRVVHEEQKSAYWPPFRREIRRYARIFRDQLTTRERRRLVVVRALRALRVYQLRNAIRNAGGVRAAIHRRVILPTLKLGGDLLEHVPERIRPPIRSRDRQARSKGE